MKKFFQAMIVGVIFIIGVQIYSQEKGAQKTITFTEQGVTAPTSILPALKRRELTLRQRRQLGLTVNNIQTAVKELKDSGEITEETSASEAAALVAERLQSKNKAGYSGVGIDWDAIIAFIEMILKLIGMYS